MTWAFGSTPTGCFPGRGDAADSGMTAGTALAERRPDRTEAASADVT